MAAGIEGQGEADGVRSNVLRVPIVELEKVEPARGRGVGGRETEEDRRREKACWGVGSG